MTAKVPAEPARSAIVCGGSLAGLLAARALADHARVTVIESDVLPEGPEHRRGLPQARHVHMLWSGGAQAIEELIPGTTDALKAHGTHYVPIPQDMVALSPRGWFPRWRESHYVLLCSRALLDSVVRRQVLAHPRITVLERTQVLGLVGDARAVTGVRTRTGEVEEERSADLVVDATGRGSRATVWLKDLGLPAPLQRTIDPGVVYASRVFQAPEKVRNGYPVVNVQADPRADGPGTAGALAPIENGRWLVTLSGTRGGEPTGDPDGFMRFALNRLRHPIIGQLIANATPLSDVAITRSRSTASRRIYYERARRWPERFVVVGDALSTYNPVYGQGMSVAAQSARALRNTITRHGWKPGLARRLQKAVARPAAAAWDMAAGQDIFYSGAAEQGPTFRDRVVAAYVSRLMYASTGDEKVAHAVTRVTSMEHGAYTLLAPRVVLAALRGPRLPQLGSPPLTEEELAAAGVHKHEVEPGSPLRQSCSLGFEAKDIR
ncbi:NAD(P)/FAD-dependent oxidoreductase [Streptomyces macrosporus]|uniref:FAD-dependent monooxygenase n=1 Tax=Streptomyces macrosporus TaxID=44032 RepID=A0ABP5X4Z1_9ACTN